MSISETYVTVQGWVGSEPKFKEVGGQYPQVSFRLGSTPRQFERALGTWVDKSTTWFSVECWRHLAQNAFDSIRVGHPVIVTGRLRTHEWTDETGEQRSRVVLEAFSLGHDLTRGVTTFTRQARHSGSETQSPSSPGADASAPSADRADVPAPPYPADEYSAAPLPLTAEVPVPEAA